MQLERVPLYPGSAFEQDERHVQGHPERRQRIGTSTAVSLQARFAHWRQDLVLASQLA